MAPADVSPRGRSSLCICERLRVSTASDTRGLRSDTRPWWRTGRWWQQSGLLLFCRTLRWCRCWRRGRSRVLRGLCLARKQCLVNKKQTCCDRSSCTWSLKKINFLSRFTVFQTFIWTPQQVQLVAMAPHVHSDPEEICSESNSMKKFTVMHFYQNNGCGFTLRV